MKALTAFVVANAVLLAGALAAAGFFWAWWSILEVADLNDSVHRVLAFFGAVGAILAGYLTPKLLTQILARR